MATRAQAEDYGFPVGIESKLENQIMFADISGVPTTYESLPCFKVVVEASRNFGYSCCSFNSIVKGFKEGEWKK